ncbi:PFA3 [Candida margitis]|uniref:PFA3 n=1 Tax=Candida margitis TaxID=1775924 RepID=UPI002227CCDB|nr:PFA3 [Candida margitis]KAI5969875.1 PFA3 [Candida margitis]
MVAYFKTIHTGPGSPLDYPQLKIRNFSDNPFDDSARSGPQPDQEPPEFMTVHTKNTTTIEFQEQRWNYRGVDRYNYEFDANGKQKKLSNIFDLGKRQNFKEVFGDGWMSWLLPVSVTKKVADSGFKNGINFKVNEEVYKKWCNNAELQNQLNEQLSNFKDRVRRERESYVEV